MIEGYGSRSLGFSGQNGMHMPWLLPLYQAASSGVDRAPGLQHGWASYTKQSVYTIHAHGHASTVPRTGTSEAVMAVLVAVKVSTLAASRVAGPTPHRVVVQ